MNSQQNDRIAGALDAKRIDNYALDTPFSFTGHWWLPDKPDHSIVGTITYSGENTLLELSGTFREPNQSDLSIDSFERVPVIHGISNDGVRCTLVKNFPTALSYNIGGRGPSTCAYSAIYVIIGANLLLPITFKSMEIYSSAFDEIAARNHFAVEFPDEPDPMQVKVSHGRPVIYRFPIPSRDATLSLGTRSNFRPGRAEFAITTSEYFDIDVQTTQPLDWFIVQTWHLCYLFSLLSDDIVSPRQLICHTANGDGAMSLIYQHRKSHDKREPSAPPLFGMADVLEQFGTIANTWFTASDTLTTAIHLFMHAHRYADADAEARFLTVAQALEVFSRAKGHAEYLPSSQWTPFAEQIVGCIPTEIRADHRSSLKTRIRYGNEFSLRKRVTLLLDSLGPDAKAIVCKSPDAFVNGIVSTRNYLTHYTDELRAEALKLADLAWACDRVLMLLRLLLFKELGIDETMACKRIQDHPRLLQHIHLYRKYRECVEAEEEA